MSKVWIYDTTLRDGEQMPHTVFTKNEKIEIAKKLAEIGVTECDAGFPAVCKEEQEAIKALTKLGLNMRLLVLSRLLKEDVDLALKCNVDGVLLYIPSSLYHQNKFTKSQILKKIPEIVSYAKTHGLYTSFSTEDSTRSDEKFLQKVYSLAITSGANRIGITDTVGCATPEKITHLVKRLKNLKVPISLHLHNDFGLALANALAGLKAGANVFACTVLSIGERGGNLALEQFVCTLKFLYNIDLGLDCTKLTDCAKLVAKYANIDLKNKPIVGAFAFAHESGIHVNGILKNTKTYEFIKPENVGNVRKIILGKHSGKSAIKYKLKSLNINCNEKIIKQILNDIKSIACKKIDITDDLFSKIAKSHAK